MQVVLLAGGLGSRLRPLTESVPKPMVEVAGRPFLEYIVEHLAAQGFTRMLFLVGYLGEKVRDHFGDGSRFGVSIEYSWEPAPLGTGGAIRNALDQLDDKFLLLFADSFLPIDYRPLALALTEGRSLGIMAVYDNRRADTGVVNNVAMGAEGYVVRYEKGNSAAGLQYVEAGVLGFRREVFEAFPAGRIVSMEQAVYPGLIAQRQLLGYITEKRFFDIGTPERLREFAAGRS